jgi:YHS domain-containing protein
LVRRGEEEAMAAIDPVCGMRVEEAEAPATAEYEGQAYYFCSNDCKEEFLANPTDYAT